MDKIVVEDTILPPEKLSAKVLLDAANRAKHRWEEGDRAGAYLELHFSNS